MNKINIVHMRKVLLAESWGCSRFCISDFFFIFHFDHFKDLGFETIIDSAKGGSFMVKILGWVKSVWVSSI